MIGTIGVFSIQIHNRHIKAQMDTNDIYPSGRRFGITYMGTEHAQHLVQ